PIPVCLSGVMLLEYTDPNGPSYFRPQVFSVLPGSALPGSVWHPHPAAAPRMYLPRPIRSLAGLPCPLAGPASDRRSPAGMTNWLNHLHARKLMSASGRIGAGAGGAAPGTPTTA